MKSERSTRRDVKAQPYWLLIAAAPFIPAFFNAVRTYLDSRFGRGHTDWDAVIFTFVDWILLGGFAPFVYILANRYRVRRPHIFQALSVNFLVGVALCLVWGVLGVIIGRMLHQFAWPGGLLKNSIIWILITLPYSLMLYILMLGCMYAFTYYREAREREAQQARLAAQLAEARLSALRMQLNPHFLFNSLNAITVLVRDQQNQDASQMLELLSDVLRQVLKNKKSAEITLAEELTFIEKYLAIEQVRFSDRLEVRWSIEPT